MKDLKTERVHLLVSQTELTDLSKWAVKKGLRTRAQGIRRLVKAAMAIDLGYQRLREAERLVLALREHVQAAVRIRLAGGAPAEVDRLLAELTKHYPGIDRAADDLAELMREINEQLLTDSRRG